MEQGQAAGRPCLAYLATGADHTPYYVADHYRDPYRHLGLYLSSFYGIVANYDENVGRLEEFLRRANTGQHHRGVHDRQRGDGQRRPVQRRHARVEMLPVRGRPSGALFRALAGGAVAQSGGYRAARAGPGPAADVDRSLRTGDGRGRAL